MSLSSGVFTLLASEKIGREIAYFKSLLSHRSHIHYPQVTDVETRVHRSGLLDVCSVQERRGLSSSLLEIGVQALSVSSHCLPEELSIASQML